MSDNADALGYECCVFPGCYEQAEGEGLCAAHRRRDRRRAPCVACGEPRRTYPWRGERWCRACRNAEAALPCSTTGCENVADYQEDTERARCYTCKARAVMANNDRRVCRRCFRAHGHHGRGWCRTCYQHTWEAERENGDA